MRWLMRLSLATRKACQKRAFHHSGSVDVSARDLQFGQPVHETHPHLLKPQESMYIACLLRDPGIMLIVRSNPWYIGSRVRETEMEACRPA